MRARPAPSNPAAIEKNAGYALHFFWDARQRVRTLGMPTLTDRPIQQALHQVLQVIFDPEFGAATHGLRPGRNIHHAS